MRRAAVLVLVLALGCSTNQKSYVGCRVAVAHHAPPHAPTAVEQALIIVLPTLVIGGAVTAGYFAIGGEAPLR